MKIWARFEDNGRYSFALDDNGGVEISGERHLELLRAESGGKSLAPGEDGMPAIVDPAVTEEALRENERRWRTAELDRYEWVVTRHRDEVELGTQTTVTSEQYAELLTYRQALRDWPAAEAFPVIEDRPTPPGWLTALTQ